VALLDYSTAYPSVHRGRLAALLYQFNIVGRMRHQLCAYFSSFEIHVLHPGIAPAPCSFGQHFLSLKFCSCSALCIVLRTAFDHADSRFTPLSCHSYFILCVRFVHCRHSSGNGRGLSAWMSSFVEGFSLVCVNLHPRPMNPTRQSRFCEDYRRAAD
jgi:hypothetical protein